MDFKSRVALTLLRQVLTFNEEHPDHNLEAALDDASNFQVIYHLRLTLKPENKSMIYIYDISMHENIPYEVMTSIKDIQTKLQEQINA